MPDAAQSLIFSNNQKFLDNPEFVSFPALKEGLNMLLDDSRRAPR